ncbi:uL15 family ribosomal protein [Candidatus Parcubacteria bacterium]|nr:uL15 family ribosomal protein [Candidatus Parcubacteria bacterium]
MQLHEVKPKHKPKTKKRIARGGKRGTYSGRGVKGQKSRAGRKFQPIIRELIKKYHKLRGYKRKSSTKGGSRKAGKITILNIEILENKFKTGEKINPAVLLKREIISKIKGKTPRVKILGKGELTKKFTIERCEVSKTAKEKVEKAGGEVK